MQLFRPALLCKAAAGGSAQAQAGLLAVTDGPAEVLDTNILRADKPAHTTWTGELLWTTSTEPAPTNAAVSVHQQSSPWADHLFSPAWYSALGQCYPGLPLTAAEGAELKGRI